MNDHQREGNAMSARGSKDSDRQHVHPRATSVPQRLARTAAVHPWRVVAVWGLILAASVVAIGTLIGSAFTGDGSITTNPDSMKADQVVAANFSQAGRTDDAVVIASAQLTSEDAAFRGFVADLLSSIEATGAAQTVRDPYADDGSGISENGHAAVITLVLGNDPEAGIVDIIDEVSAADADAGFVVDITGTHTL